MTNTKNHASFTPPAPGCWEQDWSHFPTMIVGISVMPCPVPSQKERHAMLGEQKVIHGLAASSGKCVGRARIVLRPEEFSKVQKGDVLVARVTAPSYNVLLPMLAGIVTDRGGLLSHPAIVSREYDIPGVVGSKHATTTISDCSTVEVAGDAGTVRVLN